MIPLAIVILAVVLQIAAALILKALADADPVPVALAVGIGVVLVLHGLRFLTWGFAHRRYPLSTTYPLSSVFFPLMCAISYAYGDPVGPAQLAGTALITAGVAWIALRSGVEPP